MANQRIYRYEVPVDGDDREMLVPDRILHVACRRRAVVEFWALWTPTGLRRRYFRVFGTGHEIGPAEYAYVGTALVPIDQCIGGEQLVWHLMERV
jgi:hypothetical protein